MGCLIDALRKLQTVELALADLRRRDAERERRVQNCQTQYDRIIEQIESNKVAARERQIRLDALTLDIATREAAIAKHREALSKTRTNREYAAILTAMNTEKADTTKYENTALQLMEEIQGEASVRAELEEKAQKMKDRLDKAQQERAEFLEETQPERERLMAAREECAQEVPPETMQMFIRVAEHHEGEAMAPVERSHPKREEYICTGCHMKLTLEIVSSLQSGDKLQFCSVCGRILYLDPALAR